LKPKNRPFVDLPKYAPSSRKSRNPPVADGMTDRNGLGIHQVEVVGLGEREPCRPHQLPDEAGEGGSRESRWW
jgi:hypothetical protein